MRLPALLAELVVPTLRAGQRLNNIDPAVVVEHLAHSRVADAGAALFSDEFVEQMRGSMQRAQ